MVGSVLESGTGRTQTLIGLFPRPIPMADSQTITGTLERPGRHVSAGLYLELRQLLQ